MDRKFSAGVWEQGRDFVEWSRHSTEALARAAAIRYARKQAAKTGGPLSWAGGVRTDDGAVRWYGRDGQSIREQ